MPPGTSATLSTATAGGVCFQLARSSRCPGLPHHVTLRGNRRERVFFGEDDYALYPGKPIPQAQRGYNAVKASK